MSIIGRKTLKSSRARSRQIDRLFEQLGYMLLLMYACFCLVAWISYRPAIQVHTLVIEGVHGIDGDAVRRVAEAPLSSRFFARINRDNMFLYPKDAVLRDIRALDTRIASVALAFDTRNTLHFSIQEFSPAMLYCRTQQDSETAATASSSPHDRDTFRECFFADDRGYIFASAPDWNGAPYVTFLASSPEIMLGTHILPEDVAASLREFLATLTDRGYAPHTVTLLGDNDFRITTSLPWDILWSSARDPKKSADNLALVLASIDKDPKKDPKKDPRQKSTLTVIDLRFGNKIFYK